MENWFCFRRAAETPNHISKPFPPILSDDVYTKFLQLISVWHSNSSLMNQYSYHIPILIPNKEQLQRWISSEYIWIRFCVSGTLSQCCFNSFPIPRAVEDGSTDLTPNRNAFEDIFTGGVFLSLNFCFSGNSNNLLPLKQNHLLPFLTIRNFIENFKYILFQLALFVGF